MEHLKLEQLKKKKRNHSCKREKARYLTLIYNFAEPRKRENEDLILKIVRKFPKY